ncbi:PAS domain-containing protein [Zobellella iuensis]|uniref:histidine kinase n=1 Tax=Zobellella iuensis TaxID=2803811 RepID=A0ABS1QPU0_9GAMM|nr:PAS domain-containing protein [Zobellella iuensis]MBL1376597.1 PAS domain-containing protein [Zobellella iuensis]
MKNWLFTSKNKPAIMADMDVEHTHPGVIFHLDDECHILNMYGTLSSLLPAPCQHFSELLATPLIDRQPRQWQGQHLSFSFRTKSKDLLHTHGSLHKMDTGWKLILIDNTKLVTLNNEKELKIKLFNNAMCTAQKITNSSPGSLPKILSDGLFELTELLQLPGIAVLTRDNNGQWKPYQQAFHSNSYFLYQDNRALSELLDNKNNGKPITIPKETVYNGTSKTIAIPYHGQHGVDAWLLVSTLTPISKTEFVNEKDWASIANTLLSSVIIKISEIHYHYEKARYHCISQSQGVFWWEYDANRDTFQFSEQMQKKLGIIEYCTRNDLFQLINPADRDEFRERLSDASTRGISFQQSIRLKIQDSTQWFQFSFTPHAFSLPGCIIGSLLDINKIQHHEQEATAANERIRSLIANAPAIIYFQKYHDGALENVFFSNSLNTLLGWDPEQFNGELLLKCIHPDDKDIFYKKNKVLLKNGVVSCNYRLIDAEGSYHWFMDEAKLLYDQLGKPQEVVGLYIDVTDATVTGEKLYQSEERYRILVEDSPAIICRYNTELELTFANNLFLSYLSIDSLNEATVNLKQFLSEEQLSAFRQRIASLSSETPIINTEICLHLPNREPIWVVWAERGVFDEHGKLSEVQAVGRDNTEVYNARLEMYQSAKMAIIGEMATTLAHEMNQPLNVMRISLTNLLRKINNDGCNKDYIKSKLNRIEDQIIRSAKIIEHLRFFGRRSALEMTLFDPQHAIDGALSLTRDTLIKNNIEIHVSSQPSPMILGHQDQLEQVLINLLVNARDAIAQRQELDDNLSGLINIVVHTAENQLLIQVEDNGGGIPEHHLKHIFESFFTTKPAGQGTGLGLPVSFGIIEQMKGSLTAENADNGALFTIRIPFNKA